MQLHQINVAYDPEQDRLLVSVSTTARVEYRFWLTRRLLRALWPALLQLMGNSALARSQAAPAARRAVVEFEHEQAVRGAQFAQPYAGGELQPGLPEGPLLATRVQLRTDAGRHQLAFLPRRGEGFTLQLTEPLLHALARLLQDALKATDWDLALALPAPTPLPEAVKPN